MAEIFGHEPDPASGPSEIWRDHLHADDARRIDAGLDGLGIGEQWTPLPGTLTGFGRGDALGERSRTAQFRRIPTPARATVRVLGRIDDIHRAGAFSSRTGCANPRSWRRGKLTGGVAHDFNNLCTIIMGNNEVLQDRLAGRRPPAPDVEL